MDCCWSCLVVIENGAKVCPLCGADQTPLPPFSGGEAALLVSPTQAILRWVVPVAAILCLLGAAAWLTIRKSDDDSPAKAEAKARTTLLNIRLALSQYALSKGDKYPSTLEPLDAQIAGPVQDTRVEGYSIVYKSLPSEGDGMIRSFTLLAQAEKKHLRSFYIDQSGVLRATEESRPARIDDPPI
jgi:hypothetical protein